MEKNQQLPKHYKCGSCGLLHKTVEASGIYYCPNPACNICGASWAKSGLKSTINNESGGSYLYSELVEYIYTDWTIKNKDIEIELACERMLALKAKPSRKPAGRPKSYRQSEDRYCGNCQYKHVIVDRCGYDGITEVYCKFPTQQVPEEDSSEWEKWKKANRIELSGVCDKHKFVKHSFD